MHESFNTDKRGYRPIHWVLDAGKDVSFGTQLRLEAKSAEERLVAHLMLRADKERKRLLTYLSGFTAFEEMNRMVRMNTAHAKRRNSVALVRSVKFRKIPHHL